MDKIQRPCSPGPERDDGAGPATASCRHGHELDDGGCSYSLWIAILVKRSTTLAEHQYALSEIKIINDFDPAKAQDDNRLRVKQKPEFWYRFR